MNRADIEQALPGAGGRLGHFAKEIGINIRVPVRDAVRIDAAKAVRAVVLRIGSAEDRAKEMPFLRAEHEGVRVGVLDARGVGDHLVADFIHRCAGGMHVAVRGMPDARLVIEMVIAQAAVHRRAPAGGEMVEPALLERGSGGDVRVRRIVGEDERSVQTHAVAAVWPEGFRGLLRTILRQRITPEPLTVRTEPRNPVEHRNGEARLRAAVARVLDEAVAMLARRRAVVGDAEEVIIVGAIVGVGLPVVARGVVAALPIERRVQLLERVRGGEGHAVNARVDGATVRRHIDADVYAGVRGRWCVGDGEQRDIINVERRLSRACPVLKIEAIEVRLIHQPQCRERNRELAPGIRGQRRQVRGHDGHAVRQALQQELLSARSAAVQPERDRAKGRRVLRGMMEIQRLPGIRSDPDGAIAAVNRSRIVRIRRGPAPVFPIVLQRVGEDGLIGLRSSSSQEERGQHDEQGSHTNSSETIQVSSVGKQFDWVRRVGTGPNRFPHWLTSRTR